MSNGYSNIRARSDAPSIPREKRKNGNPRTRHEITIVAPNSRVFMRSLYWEVSLRDAYRNTERVKTATSTIISTNPDTTIKDQTYNFAAN